MAPDSGQTDLPTEGEPGGDRSVNGGGTVPVMLVETAKILAAGGSTGLPQHGRAPTGFRGKLGQSLLVPGPDGRLRAVLIGWGDARARARESGCTSARSPARRCLAPTAWRRRSTRTQPSKPRSAGGSAATVSTATRPRAKPSRPSSTSKASTPRGSIALPRASSWPATSSTRRPTTWGRRRWKPLAASSRDVTRPASRSSRATICWAPTSR